MGGEYSAPVDRVICAELRTENSRRWYYNHAGDWRPRWIVWPEYNGYAKPELEAQRGKPLDGETDEAWGNILAEAVRDFCHKKDLNRVVLRRNDDGARTLTGRLSRALSADSRHWIEETTGPRRLTPDYLNHRQRQGHEHVVYLLTELSIPQLPLADIVTQPVLDRATLLPHGRAILELGTDEPFAELCFERWDDVFIEQLKAAALRYQHRFEPITGRHFLPHWIGANRRLGSIVDPEAF